MVSRRGLLVQLAAGSLAAAAGHGLGLFLDLADGTGSRVDGIDGSGLSAA